mmetsp:Transcript_12320/g.29855  ORF Transcript_12320/g.29855 Transcript_12320/m.29855 type:complete len:112 (-) Transcript_12320:1662-1997(-)
MSCPCVIQMMCVQTPLRKSCEWLTRIRHFLYLARYPSSQTHASRSRWFVGSSSSSKVGCANRALASATRMRHPPDMSLVALWIMACVKPRAKRSSDARTSKVLGSISSKRS